MFGGGNGGFGGGSESMFIMSGNGDTMISGGPCGMMPFMFQSGKKKLSKKKNDIMMMIAPACNPSKYHHQPLQHKQVQVFVHHLMMPYNTGNNYGGLNGAHLGHSMSGYLNDMNTGYEMNGMVMPPTNYGYSGPQMDTSFGRYGDSIRTDYNDNADGYRA
ncbi:hypothetical protein QR98_0014160 [Sarcoptes scabiei]|nr:hypothetical protein QR98_0014160 [Sarcoptes scabiei]